MCLVVEALHQLQMDLSSLCLAPVLPEARDPPPGATIRRSLQFRPPAQPVSFSHPINLLVKLSHDVTLRTMAFCCLICCLLLLKI